MSRVGEFTSVGILAEIVPETGQLLLVQVANTEIQISQVLLKIETLHQEKKKHEHSSGACIEERILQLHCQYNKPHNGYKGKQAHDG